MKKNLLFLGMSLFLLVVAPTFAQDPVVEGEAVDTSAVEEIFEQEEGAAAGAYTYDPAGRRDPFRSLLVGQRTGDISEGLGGILVDELNLMGIWKTQNGWIAQMVGPDNKNWLVRPGDQLRDGEVLDVSSNEIVFRQLINDPGRLKPFREVVKELVPTEK